MSSHRRTSSLPETKYKFDGSEPKLDATQSTKLYFKGSPPYAGGISDFKRHFRSKSILSSNIKPVQEAENLFNSPREFLSSSGHKESMASLKHSAMASILTNLPSENASSKWKGMNNFKEPKSLVQSNSRKNRYSLYPNRYLADSISTQKVQFDPTLMTRS